MSTIDQTLRLQHRTLSAEAGAHASDARNPVRELPRQSLCTEQTFPNEDRRLSHILDCAHDVAKSTAWRTQEMLFSDVQIRSHSVRRTHVCSERTPDRRVIHFK